MGVTAESKPWQVESYLAALEQERRGYETRLADKKAGRDEPLSEAQLADRVKQVDAESKRAKALLPRRRR
ncbi:MAG: hypothetical protein ACRDNG_04660 [Gaiellaceae bacterium]